MSKLVQAPGAACYVQSQTLRVLYIDCSLFELMHDTTTRKRDSFSGAPA